MESLDRDVRTALRDKDIHYISVITDGNVLRVTLHDASDLNAATECDYPQ